jgi:hypothetical protein
LTAMSWGVKGQTAAIPGSSQIPMIETSTSKRVARAPWVGHYVQLSVMRRWKCDTQNALAERGLLICVGVANVA